MHSIIMPAHLLDPRLSAALAGSECHGGPVRKARVSPCRLHSNQGLGSILNLTGWHHQMKGESDLNGCLSNLVKTLLHKPLLPDTVQLLKFPASWSHMCALITCIAAISTSCCNLSFFAKLEGRTSPSTRSWNHDTCCSPPCKKNLLTIPRYHKPENLHLTFKFPKNWFLT